MASGGPFGLAGSRASSTSYRDKKFLFFTDLADFAIAFARFDLFGASSVLTLFSHMPTIDSKKVIVQSLILLGAESARLPGWEIDKDYYLPIGSSPF